MYIMRGGGIRRFYFVCDSSVDLGISAFDFELAICDEAEAMGQ
jgi:hypothetical protein